jgi:hypothetical protein
MENRGTYGDEDMLWDNNQLAGRSRRCVLHIVIRRREDFIMFGLKQRGRLWLSVDVVNETLTRLLTLIIGSKLQFIILAEYIYIISG